MELGEYAQAIGDFGTCIGLWPEHPWGYFNRGYVLDRSGMKADAIADYTTALDRDPGFVAAQVNRGLARVELKQYRPALEDFDQALELGGQGDAALHAGRGIALEALGRDAEADSAFQVAFALAPHNDPAHVRLLWTYGFAVASRLPSEATEAFDDVLRHDPHHPQALYGKAMQAMDRGRLDDALRFFDHALEATPAFVAARRYRAVVLARQGAGIVPRAISTGASTASPGPGKHSMRPPASPPGRRKHSPPPVPWTEPFELLQRALSLGSGQRASEDPDLTGLRSDPRFRRLITTTSKPEPGVRPQGSTFALLHP